MLSVIAPITSSYMVKGYVVIHCDMNDIQESCNSLLNISYITLVILLLLSLIIHSPAENHLRHRAVRRRKYAL